MSTQSDSFRVSEQHATSISLMQKLKQWFYQRNQGGRLTTLLIFLPPALMVFTLFVILPIGEAGMYSLFKWNGLGEFSQQADFVGWRNFDQVLGHSVFHTALINTAKVILVSVLIQLPLAMAVALMVSEQGRLNSFLRLVYFLPFILAEVVAGVIWRYIYDGDYGLVGIFTTMFGMDAYYPLAERDMAFNAILMVLVWKYFGYHMMIYIAGLQGVPKDLIEAAHMDGASRWQITFKIRLPLIMHAVKLSLFFSIIGSLQFFEMIIPLTNGGPSNSSHTLVTYLYQYGIVRMKVGFGSAIGVILFLMCVVFAFIYQKKVMDKSNT